MRQIINFITLVDLAGQPIRAVRSADQRTVQIFSYIALAPVLIKRLNKPSDQPVSFKTADEDTSI